MQAAIKRLTVGILCGICGFAGAFCFSAVSGSAEAQAPSAQAPPSSRALVAGELRLTDETGRTRLLMTLVRGKPRMFMLDDSGEYRLEMGLGQEGEPHVWLRDKDGASKVQLALSARGLPSLTLADQRDRERAVLALSREGEPTFLMRDDKGADRVAVWRDKDTGGMALADTKGQTVLMISAKDGQRAEVQVF
ncbi:MAG: hypothetical protein LBR80_18895 [Deltaproteobacteria bacterium]|jgi:hypothetical protein|nr:hypothetical protein [Deltaproteobacteria bacterium]